MGLFGGGFFLRISVFVDLLSLGKGSDGFECRIVVLNHARDDYVVLELFLCGKEFIVGHDRRLRVLFHDKHGFSNFFRCNLDLDLWVLIV